MVLADVWAFYLKVVVKFFIFSVLDVKNKEKWVFPPVSLVFCRFSPLLRNYLHFSTVKRIPTPSKYPWCVLVLIDSSQIFRGATHRSRREIWCPPQEQGPHCRPCFVLIRKVSSFSAEICQRDYGGLGFVWSFMDTDLTLLIVFI